MDFLRTSVGVGALIALTSLVAAPSVAAVTMQECSAQYKAAKSAGTLGAVTWQEFRKTRCGPAAPSDSTYKPAAGAPGRAVFPSVVSPRHSGESAGKARMQTCLDQYKANKVSNANGGLRWIQKGGGYYSECNKRLKG